MRFNEKKQNQKIRVKETVSKCSHANIHFTFVTLFFLLTQKENNKKHANILMIEKQLIYNFAFKWNANQYAICFVLVPG